jgi:hypothetical protein
VTTAFNTLHAYIATGGLEDAENVARLGDWIDLEGGLTVAAYNGDGGFTATNDDIAGTPFDGYEGKKLRCIVVEINSFKTGRGMTAMKWGTTTARRYQRPVRCATGLCGAFPRCSSSRTYR